MTAQTRRGLLGNAAAAFAGLLVAGGAIAALARPDTLPAPVLVDEGSDEAQILERFRSLDRRSQISLLSALESYSAGEVTLEQAAEAFFLGTGETPARAAEMVAQVKAQQPSPHWATYHEETSR